MQFKKIYVKLVHYKDNTLVRCSLYSNILYYLYLNKIYFIGFGMLESGCVSVKNEVNIMMKNVVDIVLGGNLYILSSTFFY